jgi:hypothetical protein
VPADFHLREDDRIFDRTMAFDDHIGRQKRTPYGSAAHDATAGNQ